jgi:hypothetical protein
MCDIVIIDPPYGLKVAAWDESAWGEEEFFDFFEILKVSTYIDERFSVCAYISAQQVRTLLGLS